MFAKNKETWLVVAVATLLLVVVIVLVVAAVLALVVVVVVAFAVVVDAADVVASAKVPLEGNIKIRQSVVLSLFYAPEYHRHPLRRAELSRGRATKRNQ